MMIIIHYLGATIERFCDITSNEMHAFPARNDPHDDRIMMVRAARTLLSAVTRVLLLADIVVVKQLLLSKERVSTHYFDFIVIIHFYLFTRNRDIFINNFSN